MRGIYTRNEVYAGVTGWASFEPWLPRIEGLDEGAVWTCAGSRAAGVLLRQLGRAGEIGGNAQESGERPGACHGTPAFVLKPVPPLDKRWKCSGLGSVSKEEANHHDKGTNSIASNRLHAFH